ncbi:MAG: oxygen-dependent coproporphyrinogen oxidase [Alphaproteobacteria bacterium]|nr:oxygen-dependent coproporphyrinogen oxidase [Alphaproteobacteria bacterium]
MKNDKSELPFSWFKSLRDSICEEFEKIENELTGEKSNRTPGKFVRTPWDYHQKGGGEISLMHGRVFEKVGVNISCVEGSFSPEIRSQIPGTEKYPHFKACGISLVAHMHSPKVPAVHMNTRFIQTKQNWFGGGADLNPAKENKEDTDFFHEQLKRTCDIYDENYYPKFKEECDKYFFIKHRNESRGVGGIFYDYQYNDTNDIFDKNFAFTKDVGKCFLKTYPQIVRKHMNKPWTKEEKDYQLFRRGRYAEFNLLYDRGTKFGLLTGGNPESIFISMPPLATWT